jgi:hypothetical protein
MVAKGCVERSFRAVFESTKESGYEQVITPHIKEICNVTHIMRK